MKRIISIILSMLMLLALLPMNILADETAGFTDVKSEDYYAAEADALATLAILEGYPDGTFGASNAITRAEMAAIVCRMIEKQTAEESKASIFTDVSDDHWAIGYINAASDEKIINGDGDGTFRPEDDVNYEEAVKMVVCALGFAGDDIEIDPADWSAAYLKIADEKDITDKLIGSKGKPATRGDVAVMVYNGLVAELPEPTASLQAGRYTGSRKVALTTAAESAEIYYTTDGTAPTAQSTKYTEEITISATCTLKAITVVNKVLVSDVLSVEYTFSKTGGSSGDSSSPSNSGNSGSDDKTDAPDGGADEPVVDSKPAEPTPEQIEESAKVCRDLEETLADIELIEFNGKTAEVIVYVKKDIELTLEAADAGTLVTNEYVRTTYADDITAVKKIIDSMSAEEKGEFKQEIMKMNTYSIMALVKYFDINTAYLN